MPLPLIPPSFYMPRRGSVGGGSGGGGGDDEDNRVSICLLVAAVLLPLSVLATIIGYQEYRFGESVLQRTESVAVRVLFVRSASKNSCVSFLDLSNGHSHPCASASADVARRFKLGESYTVRRQIWKNKQFSYYEFPDLH